MEYVMNAKGAKIRMTKKQKAFAHEYMNTGNATEAAMRTYDTEDRKTAQNIGSENLSKPIIVDYLQNHVEEMKSIVVHLARTSENDTVKLNAAKDVIDRVEGKPLQKTENKTELKGTVILPSEAVEKNKL